MEMLGEYHIERFALRLLGTGFSREAGGVLNSEELNNGLTLPWHQPPNGQSMFLVAQPNLLV